MTLAEQNTTKNLSSWENETSQKSIKTRTNSRYHKVTLGYTKLSVHKYEHLTIYIQVTFSEKGTKITSQTHIQKFEILHFSDNISKITMIQIFFSVQKSVQCYSEGKIVLENCNMELIS